MNGSIVREKVYNIQAGFQKMAALHQHPLAFLVCHTVYVNVRHVAEDSVRLWRINVKAAWISVHASDQTSDPKRGTDIFVSITRNGRTSVASQSIERVDSGRSCEFGRLMNCAQTRATLFPNF